MTSTNADVLAFGAHPDDTELSCGGTIASLTSHGRRVVVVDLTRGEMGTRGTPESRREEALAAARILRLTARENLHMPDTRIENSREHQLAVIRRVRHWRPSLCLINAPWDRHPDHGHAASLLIDSLFLSGLSKIVTVDEDGRHQDPWRPSNILHYMQDQPFEPDLVVDISVHIETKEQAILAFSSQVNVTDPGHEPETYISGTSFFQGLRARARHYGHLAGFEYGEPFKSVHRPIPFSTLDPLIDLKIKR